MYGKNTSPDPLKLEINNQRTIKFMSVLYVKYDYTPFIGKGAASAT